MTAIEWLQACLDNKAPENVRFAPVDLCKVAGLLITHEENRGDPGAVSSLYEALEAGAKLFCDEREELEAES